MQSRLKKYPLALAALALLVFALPLALFTACARPDSYNLGDPARIVVYSHGSTLEINPGNDGYSEIINALQQELRQTGKFDKMLDLAFPAGSLAEYLVEYGTATGLEIIYSEPVPLRFIGESKTGRLFIDLDEKLLFHSGANDGTYRHGAYQLRGGIKLRSAMGTLSWDGAAKHGIGSPDRIVAKSGDYRAELHRGEEGYDAILNAFLGALCYTGRPEALDTRRFPAGGLKEYLDDKDTAAWLEFIYHEPAGFSVTGKEISFLLIDLDEAAFFCGSWDYSSLYLPAPYSLSGGEALRGAVAAYFDDLLSGGVTGYVTGTRDDAILVVAPALPGTAGKPAACWVKLPAGNSTFPGLGQKVAVSFDRIDMKWYPWEVSAAGITILEPEAHPDARLTVEEAIGAALPLAEERHAASEYIMVWAVSEINFDQGRGQWLITFANCWRTGMTSLVTIDDATAAVTSRRPAFIISEDLLVNGVDLFIFGRGRDPYPGESVEKILQTFGELLSRLPRQKEASQLNPDYMVYWDTWLYEDIQFKLSAVRLKDEPEPAAPERLVSIYITGGEYETFRGISVGDSLEKVFEKFGGAEISAGRVSYGGDLLPYIQFVIEHDKVTGIILTSGYITGEQSF